jgi:hypothetical protein
MVSYKEMWFEYQLLQKENLSGKIDR